MSHHSVKRLGILGDDENASSIYVVSLLMRKLHMQRLMLQSEYGRK